MSDYELGRQALRRSRKALSISQRDLARTIGITPQYMGDIEFGRRSFPARRIEMLPLKIRRAFVTATVDELRARIAELEKLL
jgi:transcriptional regulator with XRE-family HTH domain